MKQMLETEYVDRKAMGMCGRKHMEEVFDKRRVVKETIDCLR